MAGDPPAIIKGGGPRYAMTDLDLAYMPATEMAQSIRDGELSPVEVIRNSLARIEEVNPVLNCFCFVYPEEALAQAQAVEEALAAGRALGPLAGLPVAIKDFTPTRGKITTRGSRTFADWVPDYDALIVERLRAAGAILVGKTTTPEFAYSSFTESPLWGVTRNPWDRGRSPGGSSGGSAAAVASGCVPFAEGTDMGGSVRIPASFCGIVGLKPSLGRIPMDILPTVFDSISHFGPLARTVSDAALFLSVTQGPDDRDIQSLAPAIAVPVPVPGDLAGLRLALNLDFGFYAVDPEVEAAVRRAAEVLRAGGATVEEVTLDWDREIVSAWFDYWGVFLAACFGEFLESRRDDLDPNVAALMEAGRRMDAVTVKRIEFLRTRQWHKLAAVLADHDALLCPTMAQPAPEVGRSDAEFDWVDDAGRYHGLDMTCPFNFTPQCPALSVPAGATATGLPIGLQIVGRRFDDIGVLRVAAALERLQPWSARRPAL